MIEVTITSKSGTHELGKIRIENLSEVSAEHGDYTVQFAVDTGAGWATYQRSVHNFPRKQFNVLGLLRLALDTLDEKELTLDADPDARSSSSVARRLPRTLWPF